MSQKPRISVLKTGWKVPKNYRRREILVGPVRMEIEVKEGDLVLRQWDSCPHTQRVENLVMDWQAMVICSIREELGV
jgi:hypothetical protein